MGNKSTKRLKPETINELKREVKFTPEEIQLWYSEFQSSLSSKKSELTMDEFKKVYNSLFVGDASKFAEHIFRTFDKDGNGTVNFKEFLVGLCMSGQDFGSEAKLMWAFKVYDIDGNGYICQDEMREIIEAIVTMTNSRLPDGIESAEHMADLFFQRLDRNGDGRISYQEFKEGASDDPEIIKLLECDPDPEL